MSKPVGNFECAELMTVQITMEKIWKDSMATNVDDAAPKIDVLHAMYENQTATFPDLTDPAKDRTVKIVWITDCGEHEQTECTDICDVGGDNIEADCKDYAITECFKDGFSIPEKVFRTSIYSHEEVVARALLKMKKRMLEQWAKLAFTKMLLFKGYNQNEADPFDVSGGDSYVAPSRVSADLMGDIVEMAQMNQMNSPFLISGHMLNKDRWRYEMEAPNTQNGAANVRKMSSVKMYNDLWNVDTILGTKGMLLVNRSSYAVVTKHRFDSTPIQKDLIWMFTIPIQEIPGAFLDITHKIECDDDDFTHHYSGTLRWDVFQNPLPCNAQMTGLLKIICGAAA